MKIAIMLTCLTLAAGELGAQNMHIAIEQAKRQSANNDAEQQRIANAAGGAQAAPGNAAGASAAPVDPALQATLSNIAGLQANFAAVIASGDKADPAQKTALLNNLSQAAQGAKASSDSVKKVADDLVAALAGQKRFASAQQRKLAVDIHALFNGAHLSEAQQKTLLSDVQKTLTDGGVPLDNAVDTMIDLKAVAAQTK
jgi:hypothetical protein